MLSLSVSMFTVCIVSQYNRYNRMKHIDDAYLVFLLLRMCNPKKPGDLCANPFLLR